MVREMQENESHCEELPSECPEGLLREGHTQRSREYEGLVRGHIWREPAENEAGRWYDSCSPA